MIKKFQILAACCFFMVMSCGEYPRDAGDTLHKVRNRVLRVGYAGGMDSLPPADAAGKSILEKVAGITGARVQWQEGNQLQLLKMLEEDLLDVVMGGFIKGSILEKGAGWTKPYYVEEIYLAAPGGKPVPSKPGKLMVQADPGTNAAWVARQAGCVLMPGHSRATPYKVADRRTIPPGWHMADSPLEKLEHVFGVRKGENAFVALIEKQIEAHAR